VFSGFGNSGDRSNTRQRSAPPSAQVSFIKSKKKDVVSDDLNTVNRIGESLRSLFEWFVKLVEV